MRKLIEFQGSISARFGPEPIGLSLRGQALELLFSGSTQITPAMPPSLHAVRVIELDADSLQQLRERTFRIEASEGQYLVRARSVQCHAAASGAFFSVLPRIRLAPATRWGWSLLLWLLRVLPVARLTGRRRA